MTTAEEDQLSDGEGDCGYTFFADSELYIEADVSPLDDLDFDAKAVLEWGKRRDSFTLHP